MATTRLMPLHSGMGRTVAEALGRVTAYVENPEKTNGGDLVTAYQCNPSIADQEFLFSKRQYAAITGRERKDNDVIAYHMRQSFKPGEITPELANKIGYDLAMSLTKGKHAFIVCTHVDKHHIHSHIVFNSTAIDCTRKFRNFWRSSFAIRKISDMLCLENGLSVISEPKPSRGSYGTWLGEDKAPTIRGQLEVLIDTALGQGCKDFDSFLAAMKAAGVEVKQGKHLAFKISNGKRFLRCDSLGVDYSETAIMERISGKRIVTPRAKAAVKSKPNLLIDIQSKMQQANSPGFERWAKIFNLKEMAKTVMYLQENNLTDLGELEKACDAAVQNFNDLADRTKAASARMKDISELQKHIGAYGKTWEIYAQYRKLTGRKREKFYEQHSSEITACQAAKQYFDSLGLKKLPPMQSLKQEYAMLKVENKKRYPEYKQAREKNVRTAHCQKQCGANFRCDRNGEKS
ncbi:relaxase/mobilization nuclease domain-containing protein [Enterocloster clostridioformis]|uniref:Relaxase/Mobilisation nuclease domain n=1 Tax=Enterocloster clostridioformis TaxID=1531 RepID=A0A2X2U353_9FIRM|nr:relaxase/mobilization nuclease domain-containing protein [Enterocloster clostridioformis]SQB10714.1 Relaxase/Mobilisation nuclease domain [Enterocloster clostridioformis]